jgi:hypothetical protein
MPGFLQLARDLPQAHAPPRLWIGPSQAFGERHGLRIGFRQGLAPFDLSAGCTAWWQGEMTAAPIREILVDGTVYFSGWREEPFGLMKPMQLT